MLLSAFTLGRKLIVLQLLSRVLQCNEGKMVLLSTLKLSLQAQINKKESLFSLAVDQSTDINDSAQLLIFVRCLSSSFEMCEDFLSMETLATRTHREDIFIAVTNACICSEIPSGHFHGRCACHDWLPTGICYKIFRLRVQQIRQ